MRKIMILPSLLALAMTTIPVASHAQGSGVGRHFGKNAPFKIADLPTGKVKSKLLKLPATLQKKALDHLHSFSFAEHDLAYLNIDDEGGVFYSDTYLPPKSSQAPSTANVVSAPQPISAVDAFKLHSKPGATNVIYLDFDGHNISGTAWNTAAGGAALYQAKPFDLDAVPTSFGPTELTAIHEIWHRVAEDYAPFNVDVTTELPISFGPTVGRIVITHNIDAAGIAMPSSSAGGVAYVNVWGKSNYASYYSPALIYYNNLSSASYYIAEASSHEMGHNLSLSHDGTATVGYYSGHGAGFVSWAPIMGVGYYQNVTQWSKGEYTGANNTEDDLSLITTNTPTSNPPVVRLSYNADDHANSTTDPNKAPTPLLVDTSTATAVISVTNPETDPLRTVPGTANNKGIIEQRTDVDYFVFIAGAGALQIDVNPAWAAFTRADKRGANLDIQATLYDANGVQVAQSDPLDNTNATITTTITTQGKYYLAIDGVGNTTSPYSDYGSLGQYFISGSFTSPVLAPDTTAPTPNPMTWAGSLSAVNSSTISMTATVATDDSIAPVQYMFVCASGGTGCVDSAWQTSNTYTATGLSASTSYQFQVKAKDASGNETALSGIAAATTLPPPDITPPTPSPMTWVTPPTAVSSSSISMTATVATDSSGPVQYMFVCASGGTGCVSSSWQTSNSYSATGLAANTAYTFQVKAKDAVGNETLLSTSASATTWPPIPAVPTKFTGSRTSSATTSTVKLSWTLMSNATTYEVWRCAIVGTTCNYGTTPYATTTTNLYNGTVTIAKASKMRFKIRAGNVSGWSAYTGEITL